MIKSSNGTSRLSYVIKTEVEIFGKTYKTDFSLNDRSEMKYPILLGRKFLKKGFLVDVNSYDLSLKSKKKKKKK